MPRPPMTPHDGGEPTLCTCECHQHPPGWMKHVMACCTPCERCGRPFSAGLAKHREDCGA